jgi:hypothetical protein
MNLQKKKKMEILYIMSKSIEQFVNKFMFARKINELCLNKLSYFLISSNLAHVRIKLNKKSLNI